MTQLSGLKVSIPKCGTFRIIKRMKSWAINNPELYYQNLKLPFVQPEDKLAYLGVNIHPRKSKSGNNSGTRLLSIAKKCTKLQLKPYQMVDLITRYVIPKFLYVLIEDPPLPTYFNHTDDNFRQIIKEVLHLPASISTGFIYARQKDGGLGLPRLASLVPTAH
jgi:hypothetical protein